jgi:hypothetical protein
MDWSGVRERVAALRERPRSNEIFGANGGTNGHGFRLEPRLSPSDLAALESWLAITLPDDYRGFLTEVAAGGAGPCYGVYPVRRDGDNGWTWHGADAELTDTTRINDPFPVDRVPESVLDALEREKPDEYEEDAAFDAWDARLEALLYDPSMTAGAICISDEGCGYADWLVVTGPARGTIWGDPRTMDMDLRPTNATFGEWYLGWLTECELKLQV